MKSTCFQGLCSYVFVLLLCLWPHILGFCPTNCTCDDEKLTVNCVTAGLDLIPITLNPGLRELYLSRNQIKHIMMAFTVYQKLDYLDVSYNQITELSNNSFNIPNLRELILSHNSIQKLPPRAFKGLQGLKILQMRRNWLTEIPSRIFHDMKNLGKLDLSENRIMVIQPDAFSGLHRLRSLLLRDNKLGNIPTPSFLHLTHLYNLDLGMNRIHTVPEKSFMNLQKMRGLVLDRCSISVLEIGAFAGLGSLLQLNLQENSFDDFPTDALADLIRLEELYIGQNRFKSLNEETLRPLSTLKTISIVKAQFLEAVDKRAFASCPFLEQVILNYNKQLTHLDIGTFTSLRHLESVSLRGNGFESFHPDLLQWTQLKSFDLRDNPLMCNCSVTWLWDLLTTMDQHGNWTNVRCKNPPHFHGELLKSLSNYDRDCDGNTRRNILIVGLCTTTMFAMIVLGLVLWYRRKVSSVLKKQLDTSGHCDPHPNQFQKSDSIVAFPQHNGKYRPTPIAYI